jgi:hypothetical protein
MALFAILSAYFAVILLLLAAGPLWAWIAVWRKRRGANRAHPLADR